MANAVVPIGVTCLGIVVGWLVRSFTWKFKTYGPTGLAAVLAAILGGTVLKFLDVEKTTIWWYPIGLLIGFVAFQVISMIIVARAPVQQFEETGGSSDSHKDGTTYVPGPNDPRLEPPGSGPKGGWS